MIKDINFKDYIVEVDNFPKPGICFKDITPILKNHVIYHNVIDKMIEFVKASNANIIIAPEARGFLFGAPIAYASNTDLVLVRKPGKLPRETEKIIYKLEYGEDSLEIHKNDLKPNDRVIIIDDILATGGTIKAIEKIINKTNAQLVGVGVLIDLKKLHEKDLFKNVPLYSLIQY